MPLGEDLQVLNETTENLRNDSPPPDIVNGIDRTIDNARCSGLARASRSLLSFPPVARNRVARIPAEAKNRRE